MSMITCKNFVYMGEGVKGTMKVGEQRSIRKKIYHIVISLIIIFLLFFVKLPFYVTYPGGAEVLDDMIWVENSHEDDGEFMLTTIRMGKASIIQYIIAHFNKYQFIFPEKQIRREWESETDYDHRQLQAMESSQQTATIVAFQLADEQVKIKNEGVLVSGVIEGMPAAKDLKVGDVIIEVDGKTMLKSEQLLEYLNDKKEGDEVVFKIERDGESLTVQIEVQAFPEEYSSNGETQYGVGIVGPVTKRVVETNREVHFQTDNIGGPSAGLMFSLHIYNQLIEEDLTKGYQIAGTGEILEDGTVGAIGGIEQKVVAADRAGADLFFTPIAGGNEEAAKEAATDIETDMEVVSVRTIHDAIDYLRSLPPKS